MLSTAPKLAYLTFASALITAMLSMGARADSLLIAVASNFQQPISALVPLFEQAYKSENGVDIDLDIVSASSGKLLTQLKQGAAFDLVLMADQKTIQKGVAWKLLRENSIHTYAVGRLVLASYIENPESYLAEGSFKTIALANPSFAPYGYAAVETLARMGIEGDKLPKLVYGNNVAQSFQYVVLRAASAGFVAYSQVLQVDKVKDLQYWLVPEHFHSSILQDMAITRSSNQLQQAQAFQKFLLSDEVKRELKKYGYGDQ